MPVELTGFAGAFWICIYKYTLAIIISNKFWRFNHFWAWKFQIHITAIWNSYARPAGARNRVRGWVSVEKVASHRMIIFFGFIINAYLHLLFEFVEAEHDSKQESLYSFVKDQNIYLSLATKKIKHSLLKWV